LETGSTAGKSRGGSAAWTSVRETTSTAKSSAGGIPEEARHARLGMIREHGDGIWIGDFSTVQLLY
jgi:hypothetical protein